MFNILRHTLRSKRAFIIGWSLGLALMSFLMVIFFPSFNEGGLDSLVDTLPEALRGFVGELANLKELPTYLGAQLFDIRMPIFLIVLTILLAFGITVAEEDKGQLRTLVALPVSRVGIVFGKWLAMGVISVIATLAAIAGVIIGVLTINESIEPIVLVHLGSMMALLVFAMATFVFGIGTATGSKGVTMLIALVVTVGGFIISSFSVAVDWLEDFAWLSIFSYYPAVDIAKGDIDPVNILVLSGIIVVSLTIGIIGFLRRDIRGA
jgi:ABC-type transport system involved in multi-copper enzyme maturation permease subunit